MTMVGTRDVIFYQLNAKYMEREEDIPPESKEVMYYSLAIGHHIGVFDCFKPQLKCSVELYDRIIEALPEADEARRKLAGLHKFGEIIVDVTHTKMLRAAIDTLLPHADTDMGEWLKGLRASLEAIRGEPAIYLMGRLM